MTPTPTPTPTPAPASLGLPDAGRAAGRRGRPGRAWPSGVALLAAPAVVYLVVLMAVPVAFLFGLGLVTIQRGVVVPGSFSLEHYAAVVADPFYRDVFARTFWLALLATLICLVLGYPLAHLYTRAGPLTRRWLLLAILAPLLTSAVVRTFSWLVILVGRRSLLNTFLLGTGLIDTPLNLLYSPVAVLIGLSQVYLPFMVLPLITSMEARDPAVDEAAANLGASRVQTFLHVVVPMSLPGVAAGASLVFILAYTSFVTPSLMGGGSFAYVPIFIFQETMVSLEWTRGAVLSSLLLASSLGLVWLFTRSLRRLTRWDHEAR